MSLKIDKVQLDIIINNDPARQNMRKLTDDLKQATKELKGLENGSKEWIAQSEKIKQIQSKIEGLKREIGLTGMTMKELVAHQRELNMVMSNMNPKLPQYKVLQQELTETKNRIAELRGHASQTGLSLNGLANGFNKYFGVITAGIASVTGLIFGFRRLVDTFNEYEKKVDNLSALTGLVGDNLKWLSDQAKEMSISTVEGGVKITQGADAIVDAFTKVGSARPELLKDKEALKEVTQEAIILSEAANSELQPAVEALAMVLNQFNAPATDSRRIINALAAGSKEGAGEIPYLTQAIEKSGTVAADVGMSYEQLIGTIETLAPRITQPEIAGRSLKGVILDLQKTTNDTNPAIVGFAKAIENLGNKHLSTNELMKIFGSENITVAKILIDNQNETIKYTKAVTDTNVAIEQASINTDNNASKLAQAQNKAKLMALELGEKLAPALTFSTNAFTYLMRSILAIINVYKEHRRIINSALVGLAAYSVVVYGVAAAKKVYTVAVNIATAATRAFNVASKASPWGILAGVIAAVAAAVILFKDNLASASKTQIALNDAMVEAKKKTIEQKFEIEQLLKVAKDESKSKEERLKAIKELNKISPEYLGNITLEKINTNETTQAVDKYIKSLEKKYLAEVLSNKIKEEQLKQIDLENSKIEDNISMWEKGWNILSSGGNAYIATAKNTITAFENQSNALKESKDLVTAYETKLKELTVTTDLSKKATAEDNEAKAKSAESLKTAYELLNDSIAKHKKLLEDQAAKGDKRYIQTAKELEQLESQKEKIDDLIKAQQELAEIEADGKTIKGKVVDLSGAIKTPSIDSQMEEEKLFAEKRIELEKYVRDEQIKLAEEVNKKREEFIRQSIDTAASLLSMANQAQTNRELAELNKEEAAKRKALQKQLNNKAITQEQYDAKIATLEEQKSKKELELKRKEAVREKEIAALKVGVDLAAAIAKISAQAAIYAAAVVTAPLAAVALAQIPWVVASAGAQLALIAASPIPQAAKGKYPVVGADDGKTYNASLSDGSGTRIIKNPMLVSEKEAEMVIDGPTLRNIQLNFPEVLNAIQFARSNTTPQFAAGFFEKISRATNPMVNAVIGMKKDEQQDTQIAALMQKMDQVMNKLETQKITFVQSDYEKFTDKTNKVKADFNF